MNYLPSELEELIYLSMPYVNLKAKDNYNFWLKKAALDCDQNWQDPQFKQIFDLPVVPYQNKLPYASDPFNLYLRTRTYYDKLVPESTKFVEADYCF